MLFEKKKKYDSCLVKYKRFEKENSNSDHLNVPLLKIFSTFEMKTPKILIHVEKIKHCVKFILIFVCFLYLHHVREFHK